MLGVHNGPGARLWDGQDVPANVKCSWTTFEKLLWSYCRTTVERDNVNNEPRKAFCQW